MAEVFAAFGPLGGILGIRAASDRVISIPVARDQRGSSPTFERVVEAGSLQI